MPRFVTIRVTAGEPRPWTFYYIYYGAGGYVASRRSQLDLGWYVGQQAGLKDGERVMFVAVVRTRGCPDKFVHVHPCGALLVVEPGDEARGEVEELQMRIDDA